MKLNFKKLYISKLMKFSIVITTYNRLLFLKKAIESVLYQTVGDWELVIVNDCSSDGTKDFLDSLSGPKIKAVHNPKNLHKGGARNVGIENCSGEFVCFLDDDDYYLPHHLEVFKKKINEIGNDFGLMFTQPISQYKDGTIKRWYLMDYDGTNPVAYLFHHKNGVPTPRVCIPKEKLNKYHFNPNIRIGQDTELFLRIAADNSIYPIKDHTMVQVRHDDNSGSLKNNVGLDRLNGYNYIIDNPNVYNKIPKKLMNYMKSYCYRRMCNHYNFVGKNHESFKSAFWAFYYSPFDNDWKIKLTDLIYNFPLFGKFFKQLKNTIIPNKNKVQNNYE
jgi:glycosyltransferase involved in cell wall biosynthesis